MILCTPVISSHHHNDLPCCKRLSLGRLLTLLYQEVVTSYLFICFFSFYFWGCVFYHLHWSSIQCFVFHFLFSAFCMFFCFQFSMALLLLPIFYSQKLSLKNTKTFYCLSLLSGCFTSAITCNAEEWSTTSFQEEHPKEERNISLIRGMSCESHLFEMQVYMNSISSKYYVHVG